MIDPHTTFTLEDQHHFARISGDRNPMHLDPLFARRTQAAEPAVHGIHGLLWALDRAPIDRDKIGAGIKVRFERFLYLGPTVELRQIVRGATSMLELVSGGRTATSIALDCPAPEAELTGEPIIELPDSPRNLNLDDIDDCKGSFILGGDDRDYEQLFPDLAQEIGARRARAIGSLSTLVGMLVPGLHSIFSRCEIALVDEDGEMLGFSVRRINQALRSVSIDFRGGGITGRLDAFVRTPPVTQATVAELATRHANRDFANRKGLVIGGSRGLGELTAKLLAVRGAGVTITYLRGHDDAERVAGELRAEGHSVSVQCFDTQSPDAAWLAAEGFTDVFYFATPPIFARHMAEYDVGAANRFVAVYCHHFARLCEILGESGDNAVLFWPSTTALGDYVAGLEEYTAAKAAGEKLCELLSRKHRSLAVYSERLPRLDTDQTASVIPVKSANAEKAMTHVLDAMAALRRED